MKQKFIYTLITPEGREVVIGAYVGDEGARSAVENKYPADWLGLCGYPLRQRPLRVGEKIPKNATWDGTNPVAPKK